MSVFLEFQSINYLRQAWWYLDWIKALESQNPDLYENRTETHAAEQNLVFHETQLIDDLFHNFT